MKYITTFQNTWKKLFTTSLFTVAAVNGAVGEEREREREKENEEMGGRECGNKETESRSP